MSNVLVTGASGFVGGHLVDALVRRGDRVRCLVRGSSRTDHLIDADVELVHGDVRDPASLTAALTNVEVVYHVAGLTYAMHVRDFIEVNTKGVARLQRACAARTTPPVHVLVSSIAAAGPAPRGTIRSESAPPAPVSNYGRSKRGGELAAVRWADEVPTSIVRPGIVFGPRNRDLLPVFRSIERLRVHLVPTLDPPPLSLIHAEDLSEVLVRAAECGTRITGPAGTDRNSAQGYYFAAADEYPNYHELGRMIADALGHSHIVPIPLASQFAFVIAGLCQALNTARGATTAVNIDKMREANVSSWACSASAARRDLGFQPPHSLATRLRQVGLWYRQHGWI